MSLRSRIKNWKGNKLDKNPAYNSRYPGENQDSQNMQPPYNPYQNQFKHDRSFFKEDHPLQKERKVYPIELLDYSCNRFKNIKVSSDGFVLVKEPSDKIQEKEKNTFKQKIKNYKKRRNKQYDNAYNYERDIKPEYLFNKVPGIYT